MEKHLNIGDSIKKFRELKNITREHMAAELGLSVSAYGNIERNKTDLTISRIQKIAEILEVDISQIMNFDAAQIFNISNNQLVQASVKTENMHIHTEEKYIVMLERENDRLEKISRRILKYYPTLKKVLK